MTEPFICFNLCFIKAALKRITAVSSSIFLHTLSLLHSCHVHGALEEEADETELRVGPDGL